MTSSKDERSLAIPEPFEGTEPPALLALATAFSGENRPALLLQSTPLSLQQAGIHLLETLLVIADAMDSSTPDEETLQLAYHSFELHINTLFEAEAQLVLSGHAGCFLLNQDMLNIPAQQRWRLTQYWRRLELKGLGGFMLMRAVCQDEMHSFFGQLMSRDASPDPTGALYPLSYDNAIARIDAYEGEQLARRALERAEPMGFAIVLYVQILQWVQQRYHPLSPKPSRRAVARALHDFAALCEGQQVFFLGFSAADGSPNYQAHHLTNTAILALLFGERLGLSRSQRLELALITLEHDLGKIDLPPELLHKTGPLSDEEYKTIELLPLRTARRLLDQRFAWSRLKQALIAIDVHVRPAERPSSAFVDGEPSEQGDATLFFSRIIRLCASFDALCSSRPFRAAMAPDEALCFMRGSLSERFDSGLLQKFIAFLIPAIHTATGRLLHPLPPPDERSRYRPGAGSPVLEELQRLFKLYQQERQHQVSDPGQIAALRRELSEKLLAATV